MTGRASEASDRPAPGSVAPSSLIARPLPSGRAPGKPRGRGRRRTRPPDPQPTEDAPAGEARRRRRAPRPCTGLFLPSTHAAVSGSLRRRRRSPDRPRTSGSATRAGAIAAERLPVASGQSLGPPALVWKRIGLIHGAAPKIFVDIPPRDDQDDGAGGLDLRQRGQGGGGGSLGADLRGGVRADRPGDLALGNEEKARDD